MSYLFHRNHLWRSCLWCALTLALLALLLSENARCQTPSTGALVGAVLDPTGCSSRGVKLTKPGVMATNYKLTANQLVSFHLLLLSRMEYRTCVVFLMHSECLALK